MREIDGSPFKKTPLFRTRVNKGSGIFTDAGQTLQEQYPAEEQARGRNMFINTTFRQLHKPTASIRILQHTSTSSELISRKHQGVIRAGRMKHFVKSWHKFRKDPMILDVVRGYKIPFIFPPSQPSLPNLCHLTK